MIGKIKLTSSGYDPRVLTTYDNHDHTLEPNVRRPAPPDPGKETLEAIRELRKRIGPSPINVTETIRAMREGDTPAPPEPGEFDSLIRRLQQRSASLEGARQVVTAGEIDEAIAELIRLQTRVAELEAALRKISLAEPWPESPSSMRAIAQGALDQQDLNLKGKQ